jgi:hypothetical protein
VRGGGGGEEEGGGGGGEGRWRPKEGKGEGRPGCGGGEEEGSKGGRKEENARYISQHQSQQRKCRSSIAELQWKKHGAQ